MYRRSMAQFLMERERNEERLKNLDKSEWYEVRTECLSDRLFATFIQCHMDTETQTFLDQSADTSGNLCWQFVRNVAQSILGWFASLTTVNGILGCGNMFIFSAKNLQTFLFDELPEVERQRELKCVHVCHCRHKGAHDHCEPTQSNSAYDIVLEQPQVVPMLEATRKPTLRLDTMLDLGAGNGKASHILASCFKKLFATEMSAVMQSCLRKKGYTILDVDGWKVGDQAFDLIACLNLLDRCEKPLEMLNDLHQQALRSQGLVLVALVFPVSQYVEYNRSHKPIEPLAVAGCTFEHELNNFCDKVLADQWQVVRWTKVPYLSEGNIELSYYWLIDALLLLKPL